MGLHLALFLRKKTIPKIALKKGTPYLKIPPYPRVRWLPETPPRVRTFSSNNCSSSNCCSNSCPWLWFGKIARKLLFCWFRLQMSQKMFEKVKRSDVTPHVGDLARPRQRPGECKLPPAPDHCSLLQDCRFLALSQADLGILGAQTCHLARLVA